MFSDYTGPSRRAPSTPRLSYANDTARISQCHACAFSPARGHSVTAIEDVNFAVARRRGRVADRAERLRQEHAAQYRRRPLCADRRARPLSMASASKGPNDHVAFMLQKDLLLPWRTIAQNVMLGAEIQKLRPCRQSRRKAQALLRDLPAGGFLRPLSASTVRRHAPARGTRPHARGRSVGPAARRAVLRGRRADPHDAAARSRADAASARARPRC